MRLTAIRDSPDWPLNGILWADYFDSPFHSFKSMLMLNASIHNHNFKYKHKIKDHQPCTSFRIRSKDSQVVRTLFDSGDFLHIDGSNSYMFPKVMPFYTKILCPICDFLLGGQKESAIVVFKDTTINNGWEPFGQFDAGGDFGQEITKGKHDA